MEGHHADEPNDYLMENNFHLVPGNDHLVEDRIILHQGQISIELIQFF